MSDAPPSSAQSWSRVVKESSDSGVEREQAAESVATANGSALRRYVGRREEEKIAGSVANFAAGMLVG